MFTSGDVLCCLQSDNCEAFSEHPPEPDKETHNVTVSQAAAGRGGYEHLFSA